MCAACGEILDGVTTSGTMTNHARVAALGRDRDSSVVTDVDYLSYLFGGAWTDHHLACPFQDFQPFINIGLHVGGIGQPTVISNDLFNRSNCGLPVQGIPHNLGSLP